MRRVWRYGEELIGQRFAHMTVVEYVGLMGGKDQRVRCKCDCGKFSTPTASRLVRGAIKSCGCRMGDLSRKHGMARTPEYYLFHTMRRRCSDSANGYTRKNYFERGIRVCPEWDCADGFIKFLEHVGRRPSKAHSLDRIDNDKGYEPGNVRWATPLEQSGNQRPRLHEASDDALRAEFARRFGPIDTYPASERKRGGILSGSV